MKTPQGREIKSLRTNSLNTSEIMKDTEPGDIDYRIAKLENLVAKIITQNEAITKRLDVIEAKKSKTLKKAQSYKSLTASLYSTNLNESDMDEQTLYTEKKRNTGSDFKPRSIEEMISFEFADWKRDIEKCIEKLSEKVANNSNNILIGLIETRVNDMSNEISKLRKLFDESYSAVADLRQSFENFEKNEKLVNELLSQISFLKINTQKLQSDYKADISDLKEKITSQEKVGKIQYDSLDKAYAKRCDLMLREIQSFQSGLSKIKEETDEKILSDINKLDEKIQIKAFNDNKYISITLRELEEKIQNISIENTSLVEAFKEEAGNVDGKIKALWDSFALFSSTFDKMQANNK